LDNPILRNNRASEIISHLELRHGEGARFWLWTRTADDSGGKTSWPVWNDNSV
jgi:hypothetical protein